MGPISTFSLQHHLIFPAMHFPSQVRSSVAAYIEHLRNIVDKDNVDMRMPIQVRDGDKRDITCILIFHFIDFAVTIKNETFCDS